MVARTSNSNRMKKKPNASKVGKTHSKNNLNQILGIGKPGPHLLQLRRQNEAKKRKDRSRSRESDTNGNNNHHSNNLNGTAGFFSGSMDYSGSKMSRSFAPVQGQRQRRPQSSGKEPKIPHHEHRLLDLTAHAGTYVDEYEQDLQYDYSPGLWETTNTAQSSRSAPPPAAIHSEPRLHTRPHQDQQNTEPVAQYFQPLAQSQPSEQLDPQSRTQRPSRPLQATAIYQHSDATIKAQPTPRIETTQPHNASESIMPSAAVIPSMEDLVARNLERIRERKRLKREKEVGRTGERSPPLTANTTILAETRTKRMTKHLKGQSHSRTIEQLILVAGSAQRHIPRPIDYSEPMQVLERVTVSVSKSTALSTDDAQGTERSGDDLKSGADFVRFESKSYTNLTAEPSRATSESRAQKRRRASNDDSDAEGASIQPPPGCPWMGSRRYSELASVPRMLNQELKDFVTYLSPTQEEHQVRTYVYQRMRTAIQNLWSNAVVEVFGSFETQLYLPTSDLDLVILRAEPFSVKELGNLGRYLKAKNIAEDVELITRAKVPLIKMKEKISSIAVDISFNVANGLQGAELMKMYMDMTPGLRPLTMLVKHFLKLKRSNEPFYGGIGSFLTVVMVLSFLQMHPMVQGGMIDPEENLGVLLIEFFELYGLRFNYRTTGIMVVDGEANGGAYFSINPTQPSWVAAKSRPSKKGLESVTLCALDPNDPNNDIGSGARNLGAIRHMFVEAYDILVRNVERRHNQLQEKNDEVQVSLIKDVLSISTKVLADRRHIEEVYYRRHFQTLFGWTRT
ncbi:hypothetical protein EDD11_009575 [Mortierella claussenii]|nr:hypothetical protein EDD11_009575 [Mortierella claussenii]